MRRFSAAALAAATVALAGTALALPTDPTSGCEAVAPRMTFRVTWSNIQRTNGCWFFSGPGDLGRDDHLGTSATWTRHGNRVEIRFGNVTFSGRADGLRIIARRESMHAFGAGWRVNETIEGTFGPADSASCALVARYHYDECDTGSPGTCPGHCHIDAVVRFERR